AVWANVSNRLAGGGSRWQAYSKEALPRTKAQCCQAVRPGSVCAAPGFDDPAPQHPVSLVKDRRLPRAEGPLRRVELDAQPPVSQRPNGGRSRLACVTDLGLGPNRFGQPIQAQKVEIADKAGGFQQFFLGTHHYGVVLGVHV